MAEAKTIDKIRIVLADDHPIVRHGLKQMIETDARLEVVAEAGDGETALRLIEQLQPDVAVLDVDMPKMDGFAVARALQSRKSGARAVFLTMHDEAEIFQAALDLNVLGYVLKDSALTDIVACIKAAAANRAFFSPALSAQLLNRRRSADDFARENAGVHQLTATERRILKLIAENKTSREIGEQLYISHRTVETHRSNICKKLNLQGSLALVRFAAAHKSKL